MFQWTVRNATGVRLTGQTTGRCVTVRLRGTALRPNDAVDPSPPSVVTRNHLTSQIVDLHGSDVLTVDATTLQVHREPGNDDVVELLLNRKGHFEILLPHSTPVEIIELASDGTLATVADSRPRWTHHGSSISHSTIAPDPQAVWVQQVADGWDVQLRDLSLAGNAQLDHFTAREIARTPADLITIAVGINLVNADSMRERAFVPALHGFVDIIRERQPEVPLVLIGGIICPIHEDTPGPVVDTGAGQFRAADRRIDQDAGALTLRRTREILQEALTLRQDRGLHYVDGREFFGISDAHLLFDALHPDEAGNDLLASRILSRWPSFPIG